jgi:chromate transport protein ChrA
MTRTRPFTLIAAILFAIAALLHLYRLFTHFQIIGGSHEIPQWASYVAIVVAAIMAIGLYRESRG